MASVTRIIELLLKAGYFITNVHNDDKRKTNLIITHLGLKTIKSAEKLVENYRKTALKGIGIPKAKKLKEVMNAIVNNRNNL